MVGELDELDDEDDDDELDDELDDEQVELLSLLYSFRAAAADKLLLPLLLAAVDVDVDVDVEGLDVVWSATRLWKWLAN